MSRPYAGAGRCNVKTTREITRAYGWLAKSITIPPGADFTVATDAAGITGIIGWLESHSIPGEARGWPFRFPVYRGDVDVETATRATRIQRRAGRN